MMRVTIAARWLLLGALSAAYLLSGCKKKEKDEDHSHGGPQPDSSWVEVMHEHTGPGGRIHVHVYTLLHPSQDRQVREGYNRFRIKVEGSSGMNVTNVKLVPIMYMRNHSHSCPTRQPDGKAADGYFYAEAFFQMPSTVDANGNVTQPWKLHVILGGNDTATADLRVYPHPNGWVRGKMLNTSMGEVRLLYEFRPEGAFKRGTVPVRMYVYRRDTTISRENPDAFPSASDMVQVVQLNTWMPSMNHGAEGNQPARPVSNSFGLYKGQIGFNMTGDWDIYLAFVRQQSDTLGLDTVKVRF